MDEKISTEKPYPIPSKDDEIKSFIKALPKSPGVYRFLDQTDYPLYIGKAKSLRNRLLSYFRVSGRTKKIQHLFEKARYIDISLTTSELEALLYEQFLIKEHKPQFNVQFKDDKGYPWIKVETKKIFPSAKIYLGKDLKDGNFFGPFPNGYAVRDALKLIQKTFKLRNCSDSYFKNRSRPCLQYEIGRCSAPCVGLIGAKEYLKEVDGAQLLLEGKSEELIKDFYKEMDKHSIKKSYEKAAIYRDRISALRDIQRSQSIAGYNMSKDAIYSTPVKGKIRIGITSVNQGWVTGHKNYYQTEGYDNEEILESFVLQNYLTEKKCPAKILVGRKIKNKELIESALSKHHGNKISIITNLGKKDKGLMDLCKVNTQFVFKKDKFDDLISSKLEAIGEVLKIKDIKWIESYDVSHFSGKNALAGCVVFSEKGKEKKSYRTYNISKDNWGNDIGSMIEVINRRFTGSNKKRLPDLIIIDGGKIHLKHVVAKLRHLELESVNVISISKGVRRKASFDTIHLQEGCELNIQENSPAKIFIQEIRDETHRFSISLQKRKERKLTIQSSLDNIPGIGKERKKSLLRYFGSLDQLKRASVDDLSEVSGIGERTAKLIYDGIHNP